ncbi:MAG: GNAT family N-acetyltransferase [Nocardioidaceae bacterium]
MEIRDYEDPDWSAVWPIVREIVRARETYPYDPDLTSDQAREVWVEPAPGRTVVALDGSDLLGTAKMGTNRPGPGAHVATASFMVASPTRGRGVGRAG